ncbi:glycosyl hydrolase [Paenibacillus koleovorans]|uniref:glycosyl hydrolase n=1 Tax=Paenibacillus koleovorans TaxID=121608 RepID=UPI000FDBDC25|nr:glycosyl hydrolase [Paenibacillus koleovorans]
MENRNEFDPAVFKQPPAAYRSLPLWSWNDRLEPEELRRQIREMKRAGLGGFFMHARQGLRSPYMGEEFLRAVEVSVEEAREQGMEAWCYDENGWPSGTANGIVPALGRAYRQKWLEGVVVSPDEWVAQGMEREQKERQEEQKKRQGETENLQEELEDRQEEPEVLFKLVRVGTNWQVWNSVADTAITDGEAAPWQEMLLVNCRVNPYYVDILSEPVMQAFLEACHEVYRERFGECFGPDGIPGIFTDEFKFSGLPWSDDFEQEYAACYGEPVAQAVGWLLTEADAADEAAVSEMHLARYRYWRVVSERFRRTMRLAADWCDSHGWQLTGHLMGEDTLLDQMRYTSGVMPLYERMHMPGIDMLGRKPRSVLLPKQASSVARQLGKPFVLTETFGCCGWNLSFREMKQLAQWQFVLGVNRMSPHLQAYSIRGVRKRDYPPSLFIQQPWWDVYSRFNDYFARLSYLLTLGEAVPGILVLHPMRSVWLQHGPNAAQVERMQTELEAVAEELLAMQRDFDFGDEALMAQYGRVDDGKLRVGEMEYETVILTSVLTLDQPTFELIKQFAAAGGKVLLLGTAPSYLEGVRSREVTDWFKGGQVTAVAELAALREQLPARREWFVAEDYPSDHSVALRRLFVQERRLPGMILLYVVHTGEEGVVQVSFSAKAGRMWEELDLEDGSAVGATSSCLTFKPGDARCFVIWDKGIDESVTLTEEWEEVKLERVDTCIPLDQHPDWRYARSGPNVLTLDYAAYRIDDREWNEPTYVLKIQERCIAEGKPVNVQVAFRFDVDEELLARSARSEWKLAVELPAGWTLAINGLTLHPDGSDGYFGGDRSFPTYPIGHALLPGRNEVHLSGLFYANDEVYRFFGLAGADLAPIRNKLLFDVEIESIYLLGLFAVQTEQSWEPTERHAQWNNGPFELTSLSEQLRIDDVTQQGLAFFSGTVALQRTVGLSYEVLSQLESGNQRLYLLWDSMHAIAIRISVNGGEARTILWGDRKLDLTEAVRGHGPQLHLHVELITSGRNTFGPHHHANGEVIFVGPTSFTDKIGWVDAGVEHIWSDRYCFVSVGLPGLRLELKSIL